MTEQPEIFVRGPNGIASLYRLVDDEGNETYELRGHIDRTVLVMFAQMILEDLATDEERDNLGFL